jgi:hypothetical protein
MIFDSAAEAPEADSGLALLAAAFTGFRSDGAGCALELLDAPGGPEQLHGVDIEGLLEGAESAPALSEVLGSLGDEL